MKFKFVISITVVLYCCVFWISEIDLIKTRIYWNTDSGLEPPTPSAVNSAPVLQSLCSHRQRRDSIQHLCHELGIKDQKSKYRREMRVHSEGSLGYCPIPKIGTQNMNRLLASTTSEGRRKWKEEYNGAYLNKPTLDQLGLYGTDPADSKLANYTKFFIIRHPFDRLLSAYNDKIGPNHSSDPYFTPIRERIMESIRNNLPSRNTSSNSVYRDCPTFAEFIHAIVYFNAFSDHWDPFALECSPCKVNYEYILRMESLNHDSDPIMKLLHLNEPYMRKDNRTNARPKPQVVSTSDNHFSVQLYKLEDFQDVPRKEIDILVQRYWLELKLYGYTFDVESLQTGCQFKDNKCC